MKMATLGRFSLLDRWVSRFFSLEGKTLIKSCLA